MTSHAWLILGRHHLHNAGHIWPRRPPGQTGFFNFPLISARVTHPFWNIPTHTISSLATVASWAKLNHLRCELCKAYLAISIPRTSYVSKTTKIGESLQKIANSRNYFSCLCKCKLWLSLTIRLTFFFTIL